MRIAVTGRSGQVATSLTEQGAERNIEIVTLARPEFDLADPANILEGLRTSRAEIVISAAAYTAVDKAEDEPEQAMAINAVGAGAVATAAAQLGLPIVHLSTDYVFDGMKATPYVETDATNPISVYGVSKLAGERAVATATSNHVILRTAWVYSPFGNNFLKTMLRLAADRPKMRVVGDQHGTPTAAHDIADAVLKICENLLGEPHNPSLRGLFHLVAQGEATWAEFATEIFRQSAKRNGPTAEVEVITTSEYPTKARRPSNSRLSTDKLLAQHGVSLPPWHASTAIAVERLLGHRQNH